MEIVAQSTATKADARPPYMHLGYISASPGTGFGLFTADLLVPGLLFLFGGLVVMKLNYARLIGGAAGLLKKFRFLRCLAMMLSSAALLAVVFFCLRSLLD